jgi:Na+/phosphate symporter
MTIIVAGIVAVPLSLLLARQIQSVFQSEDFTAAYDLARFDMEVVNNLPYAGINSATTSSYQGYPYTVTRTVAYAHGTGASAESTKKVTIQVTRSGSAAVIVKLVTYITKNVSYPFP